MRMSIINRILLTIYTLIIIVISLAILGLFAAMGMGIISSNSVGMFFSNVSFNWQTSLIAILVAILFIVVSIKLLLSGAKPRAPISTLIRHTDLGMIRVSASALETMIEKAVRGFKEIKDVKINIAPETEGIKVQLKVLIMPDVILPDLTASLQQKVKEYLENYSGVSVKEVFVYIDNFSAPQQRPRVQ